MHLGDIQQYSFLLVLTDMNKGKGKEKSLAMSAVKDMNKRKGKEKSKKKRQKIYS
jgi:hypothetical protein